MFVVRVLFLYVTAKSWVYEFNHLLVFPLLFLFSYTFRDPVLIYNHCFSCIRHLVHISLKKNINCNHPKIKMTFSLYSDFFCINGKIVVENTQSNVLGYMDNKILTYSSKYIDFIIFIGHMHEKE